MSTWDPIRRRLPDGADCRFCFAAGTVAVLATVAVAYVVANDDAVTALDALLLVPAATLLAGIGLSEGVTGGGRRFRRTN